MHSYKPGIYLVAFLSAFSVSLVLPFSSIADGKNMKASVEALRKNVPEAKTISEMNGFSIIDACGKSFTLTRLQSAAEKLVINSKDDGYLLIAYLEDKDPKIRFIAASALENKLKVFPNGMSIDAIVKSEPKYHKKMIEQFKEKLDAGLGDSQNKKAKTQ